MQYALRRPLPPALRFFDFDKLSDKGDILRLCAYRRGYCVSYRHLSGWDVCAPCAQARKFFPQRCQLCISLFFCRHKFYSPVLDGCAAVFESVLKLGQARSVVGEYFYCVGAWQGQSFRRFRAACVLSSVALFFAVFALYDCGEFFYSPAAALSYCGFEGVSFLHQIFFQLFESGKSVSQTQGLFRKSFYLFIEQRRSVFCKVWFESFYAAFEHRSFRFCFFVEFG